MDPTTHSGIALRRVGAGEGFVHIALGAAVLVLLGSLLPDFAPAGTAAGASLWAGWYAALRLARLRDWFGGWDLVSFAFVWGYAVALSLTAQLML